MHSIMWNTIRVAKNDTAKKTLDRRDGYKDPSPKMKVGN